MQCCAIEGWAEGAHPGLERAEPRSPGRPFRTFFCFDRGISHAGCVICHGRVASITGIADRFGWFFVWRIFCFRSRPVHFRWLSHPRSFRMKTPSAFVASLRTHPRVQQLLPWLAGAGMAVGHAAVSSNCTIPQQGRCSSCGSCVIVVGTLAVWALAKQRQNGPLTAESTPVKPRRRF